jgi:hypothetical protein
VAKLPHLDETLKIASGRAVLVVKLENFDYLDITKVQNTADPESYPVRYRILKTPLMFVDTYAKAMYSIEPGTYYISFIAIDSQNGVYYSDAPGLDPEGAIAYGAFKIQAGEVLYLGDVDCRWQSTNKIKKLSLAHKLPEVQKDLSSAGHPDLAAKIVMAKFFAKGSKVLDIK